jgi:hypothetical protein
MSETSLEKQVETSKPARDENGRLLPGNTANPNGRPKGLSITEMVKKALEEVEETTGLTWKDLIVKKILRKSVNEGDREMIKAVWSYIDGMPRQTHAIEGGEQPVLIELDIKKDEIHRDSKVPAETT